MSESNPNPEVPPGMLLVSDTPTSLLCDLDTIESVQQFVAVLPYVAEKYPILLLRIWSSMGGNTHAAMHLCDEAAFSVRLALQTALGSDPVRTVLALRDGGNLLFKPAVQMEEDL